MKSYSVSENIVKIRKEKRISQKELAEAIGTTPQTLLKIEKGIVNPRMDTLEKIISALNVTPNQLFGEELFQSTHVQTPFARNVKNIRVEAHLSQEELAEKLKISPQKVYDMEKGSAIPSSEILARLEDVLNVPQSELIENDLFTRSTKEIELLELISYRNNFIDAIQDLLENGVDHVSTPYNPDTDLDEQIIYTVNEQAFDKIISELKLLPISTLLELFNNYYDNKITKLTRQIKG